MEISGAECVLALVIGGFRVKRRAAGRTVLVRGRQHVIVPDVLVLSREVLESILAEADFTHERFLALLAEEQTHPDRATLPDGAGDADQRFGS